jgi:hypothetical protein
LTSAFALSLAPWLLPSRAGAAAFRSRQQPGDPTAWDTLISLAAGCDPELIASAMPKLLVSPFAQGDVGGAILSTNSALDVLDVLLAASAPTFGPAFLDALIAEEATCSAITEQMFPYGMPMRDCLIQAGVLESEIELGIALPGLASFLPDVEAQAGLQTLTPETIATVRANLPGYVTAAPDKCLLAITGAALSGAAVLAALQGTSSTEVAMGTAFFGVATVGITSAVLP